MTSITNFSYDIIGLIVGFLPDQDKFRFGAVCVGWRNFVRKVTAGWRPSHSQYEKMLTSGALNSYIHYCKRYDPLMIYKAVICACKHDSLWFLKYLVETYPQARTSNMPESFHHICVNGNREMFDLLLIEVDLALLHKTCMSGSIDFVNHVRLQFPFEFAAESLRYAAYSSLGLVKIIVESGVRDANRAALTYAICHNNFIVADYLMSTDDIPINKEKLLMSVCESGSLPSVGYLRKKGLLPDNLDAAINKLMMTDRVEILKYLGGCKMYNFGILLNAIMRGHLHMMAYMLDLATSPYLITSEYDVCARYYRVDAAKLLFERGLKPNYEEGVHEAVVHEVNDVTYLGQHMALFVAIDSYSLEFITWYCSDIDISYEQRKTYLEITINRGYLAAFKHIMAAFPVPLAELNFHRMSLVMIDYLATHEIYSRDKIIMQKAFEELCKSAYYTEELFNLVRSLQ